MTEARYEFDEIDAVTSAGGAVRFPAGVHAVARRSLVFRVRLGGREVDLTLAEFDRLLRAGRIRAIDPVLDLPVESPILGLEDGHIVDSVERRSASEAWCLPVMRAPP